MARGRARYVVIYFYIRGLWLALVNEVCPG